VTACDEPIAGRDRRDTRPRVAFVVQRYGADVTGGSESLARSVAERLTDHRVTVFTTCARDYVTWRNELKEGSERVSGVEVARFRNEEERDLAAFNAHSESLYGRPHTEEEELIWLKRQGPYCPRLVEQLEACKDRFEAVLFFTYLYFPTYWGLRAAPERSILVPTAHDEPPLRFSIYREMFASARALAFCSGPEEQLVRSRFRLRQGAPTAVAGIGVEVPESLDVDGFRIRHDVKGPYAVYAGRIDEGKGCAEMIGFYERYRRDFRGAAELILIGKLAMTLPRAPGVRYLGFLSEAEKMAALAGARAVVCSSPFESLSIVLLEGLGLGTPALVNARSEVLQDHCRRSNAGLSYADADEFAECLDLLVGQARLRAALGENGRSYVRENYRWEAVLGRYRALIASVSRQGNGR